jgi:hypothetical protein
MGKRSFGYVALITFAVMVFWPGGPARSSAAAAKVVPGAVVDTCLGANLSIRYVDGDAAMGGARGIYYAFKNRGTGPCTLDGVPRVQLLNRHNHLVHVNSVKYRDEHSLVTLEPGQEAFLEIDYRSTGAGDHGRYCPSVPRLRIKPPGTNRWFVRREGLDLCDDVQVNAIVATNPLTG